MGLGPWGGGGGALAHPYRDEGLAGEDAVARNSSPPSPPITTSASEDTASPDAFARRPSKYSCSGNGEREEIIDTGFHTMVTRRTRDNYVHTVPRPWHRGTARHNHQGGYMPQEPQQTRRPFYAPPCVGLLVRCPCCTCPAALAAGQAQQQQYTQTQAGGEQPRHTRHPATKQGHESSQPCSNSHLPRSRGTACSTSEPAENAQRPRRVPPSRKLAAPAARGQ